LGCLQHLHLKKTVIHARWNPRWRPS
jgi:hypothetical protein